MARKFRAGLIANRTGNSLASGAIVTGQIGRVAVEVFEQPAETLLALDVGEIGRRHSRFVIRRRIHDRFAA